MSAPRPLAGLRVVDLSTYVPGPYASMLLADFGADVLAVEPPLGDPSRSLADRIGDDSALHSWLGRGKRSLRLDLKTPSGHARLMDLIGDADVFIEGFAPGVAARLGIGADSLHKLNPSLIYCSIPGEGAACPPDPGHDINYVARSGLASQLADADGRPVPSGALIADMSGAVHAAVGILVALLERRSSGEGRTLEVSLLRSAVAFAGPQLMKAIAGSPPVPGVDLNLGGDPAYAHYRTSDGRYIAIGALEQKFWSRLCNTLGDDSLVELRFAEPDVARERLASHIGERSFSEWINVLGEAEVCFAPVNELAEALTDERMIRSGAIAQVDGTLHIGNPIRLSRAWEESE